MFLSKTEKKKKNFEGLKRITHRDTLVFLDLISFETLDIKLKPLQLIEMTQNKVKSFYYFPFLT